MSNLTALNIKKAIHFIQKHKIINSIKICSDTRKVNSGDVFIAYYVPSPLSTIDSIDNENIVCNFQHIEQAIKLGIGAIIIDDEVNNNAELLQNIIDSNIPFILLPNLYEYIGDIVSYFNHHPSTQVPVIGITGTNGKTSISTWLAQCLEALNTATCVIGTLGTGFLHDLQNTGFTTPDAISLQYQLYEYINQKNAKVVCMEVSSHGLKQARVAGVKFHSAIFTNLTQDHLDYHGNLEDYISSKQKLFTKDNLEYAIINTDDEVGKRFIKASKARHNISYTMHKNNILSDNYVYIEECNFDNTSNGYNLKITININQQQITDNIYVNILGEFNIYNLMAVIAGLLSLGYAWNEIKNVLPIIQSVAGRLEVVKSHISNRLVIVDYAHTPDALEKTLQALKPIAKKRGGKLLCLFGCGGNRDKGKRPLMARVAQSIADIIVITTDNPRFESPVDIIQNICAGIVGINTINSDYVYIIEDRLMAIKSAIDLMFVEQDVLLIAGKGHETYQDINGVKYDFNDALIAKEILNNGLD